MLTRRAAIGAAGASLTAPAIAAPHRKPEVQSAIAETSRGRVRGVINDGIRTFKGIPYGASTAGDRRFREAKQPAPWTGIRDAVAFGPMCPQEPAPTPSYTASWSLDQTMSEDCLVLNVWTPALRDHHKRPVMVWLHGGGFSNGSGANPVYDGTNLSRKGDVVVVTVNHRLNVFGHLYLARLGGVDFAESGNLGLLDLAAALRWVHVHIAEFGGDPANITIFGQAGGGAKVSLLMAMPQTRGLFHRAIVQSGSQLDGMSPDEANAHAVAFLKAADVPVNDLSRLQKMPYEQVLAAMRKMMRAPGPPMTFSPVADGRFLPSAPWTREAPAIAAQIPMLIGTTKTETTGILGATDPSLFSLNDADLRKRLSGWLPPGDLDRVILGYRRLAPDSSATDLFFAITSTRRVRQQAWAQAERKAAQNGTPVWLYELDWQTPVDGGKWQSPQSLDLPFMFDNIARSASLTGTGDDPKALAAQMSACWLAFARTGDPNVKGQPQWDAYAPPRRMTMVFDVKSRVAGDFRGDERQLLASVPLYVVKR